MSFAKYSDAIKEGDTVMVYEVSTYLCVNCVQHNMHAHTHTHVPLFFLFLFPHVFWYLLKYAGSASGNDQTNCDNKRVALWQQVRLVAGWTPSAAYKSESPWAD